MDRLRSSPASPWRAWPLLLVGVLVASLALTPAVTAAGKFIKKKKAVKLFEKKKHAAAQYALFEADAAARNVRVASADDADAAFTFAGPGGMDGTVLSTQITAPGPGFLVVNASSRVSADGGDSTGCHLRLDGATIASSVRMLELDAADPEICATGATQQIGGGTHTVDLRGLMVGGTGVTGTHGPASMSVLFVGLGATGELGA